MESLYLEFVEKGRIALRSETIRSNELEPNEVIVRNELSIISAGTELGRLWAVEDGTHFPMRPGYGAVGQIEALGSGLEGFAVGERVYYAGHHASRQRLRHGESQWQNLFRIPEGLEPMRALMACMAEIAMTGPNVSALNYGDRVAVFGLGLVGTLAAQIYQLLGVRVIALDPEPGRCSAAQAVGVETVVQADSGQAIEQILAWSAGEGVQVAVDAVGHAAVIRDCIQATAPFGQVVLLGTPRAKDVADWAPAMLDVHRQQLTLTGAHVHRYPLHAGRGTRQSAAWAYEQVFEMLASGKLRTDELISHVIRPEAGAIEVAYDGLRNDRSRYIGVVIDWRD